MSRFKGIRRLQLGKLTITPPAVAKQKPEGSIIILHGSCDTGSGMKAWLDQIAQSEFKFRNYRVLYPTAPTRPYALLNGEQTGIWFDRLSLSPRVPEDLITIEATANELRSLISEESRNTGVPLDRMVVGGFSMGGIMALHLGYRFQTQLAGVFALSSFLPTDSEVYNNLKEKTTQPERTNAETNSKPVSKCKSLPDETSQTPTIDTIIRNIQSEEEVKSPQFPRLFMSQGTGDPLVPYPWAKRTFSALRCHGVEGHFFTHPTDHNIERNQLNLLHGWIQDILKADRTSPHSSTIKEPRKK